MKKQKKRVGDLYEKLIDDLNPPELCDTNYPRFVLVNAQFVIILNYNASTTKIR